MAGGPRPPLEVGRGYPRDLIDHVDARQGFRSVVAGAIVSAGEGGFGAERVPERLRARVRPGEIFRWPLMSMLFAFDVEHVAARSLMVGWIRDCATVPDCYFAVLRQREKLRLRPLEELPRALEARSPHPGLFRGGC